jgi:type I restriction enzyme S subunit
MSLPRYHSYKDSGVEWLGDVPEHWAVFPLKRDLKFLTSGSRGWAGNYSDEGNLFIRIGNLTRDSIAMDLSDVQRVVVPAGVEGARTIVQPGDVLFSITAYLGSVAVVPDDIETAYVSQHVALARLHQKRLSPRWVAYVTVSYIGKTYLEAQGYGGTKIQLSLGDVANLVMTAPPLDEQDAITHFLDRETGKIDVLVEEQWRLIELLKEKRQAVISHVVTKGLHPLAPMKDSGVEWLGQVPEHWRVGAIKYFISPNPGAIKTGPFGSHLTSADMQASEVKVYNQRSVIDNDFSSGDNFITYEKFKELSGFETFPGDVLVTTRGTIGRVAILPDDAERGILHPCLLRIQPDRSKLSAQFLEALIQDSTLVRTQLSYMSNATTIEVIYSETMASVVIPAPPLEEQASILELLHAKTTELDDLLTEAERAIDLLQERRTALISAAVTGKIDVRGLVEVSVA